MYDDYTFLSSLQGMKKFFWVKFSELHGEAFFTIFYLELPYTNQKI